MKTNEEESELAAISHDHVNSSENRRIIDAPNDEGSWGAFLFPGPSKVPFIDEGELKSSMPLKSIPSFLNPFRLQTAGLTLSYFDVGIAIYFLVTPLTYYLITTLNISSTEYNAYSTLISLPWSLKFLFGMVTDGVPVCGYRRKSWLAFGWLCFVGIAYYMSTQERPNFALIVLTSFFMTVSYLFADVCADSLMVERARHETIIIKGSLQTSAYTMRSFGCTIGAILGALLYNTPIWGWGLSIAELFFVAATIPLFGVIPAIWNLEELAATSKAPTFFEQCDSIWMTLQRRAVWLPISFIYIYNVFQIPNAAWTNFLILGLNFSDFEIGMLTVASAVLFWLGMLAYKAFFFETGWRMIYIYTTLIGAVFSLLQILLILRVNEKIGIPDFAFALGDSSIATFVQAIQYMPACILFVMLCPDGSEGVTYALLTTISNLAGAVASDIASAMTLIWNVDNEALSTGDFTGMLYLTILTSCLQVFPLCFIWILPDSKVEQRKLCESHESNWWAGFTLASVIALSLIVSIGVNIYFIVDN